MANRRLERANSQGSNSSSDSPTNNFNISSSADISSVGNVKSFSKKFISSTPPADWGSYMYKYIDKLNLNSNEKEKILPEIKLCNNKKQYNKKKYKKKNKNKKRTKINKSSNKKNNILDSDDVDSDDEIKSLPEEDTSCIFVMDM